MSAAQFDDKAVFNAARQIGDADAREGYLQAACRDDPQALGRIRELLRVNAKEQSFLESPAVAYAPVAPAPPPESPGSVIGPYKLLEQIGEGGFGVVYMAEQTAPVRRKVALKVLKPGMDTRQVIARFEAERQALALMDHPHIAKVLDAGETTTGRPYFVMELVKGVPITEYCDAHHLTPRERLELFVPVCQAVQHAHQKGIIHRDIKPTNVLVSLHDDRPVAKVIDFGIAKATSGQLTDKTLFTGFAQLIGTPLYMSPEQASMSAIDVDTRSDIYSLGVLLYELLTGATPFEKARLQAAAFDEVRRIIREEEPEKPSTRLSTSDALPSLAANRGTEPAKLTRLVRGELDWIVMKALEKDRTRRYETANGFAADVLRYLADEPVSACPPSATYRLRKFARRNKGALLTSALVGAALLVVAGSLGWMARDGASRRGRNAEAVATLLGQAEDALRADAPDRAAIALTAAERRAADGGAEEHDGRMAASRADLTLLRDLDAIDTLRWTWSRDAFAGEEAPARWQTAFAAYGIAPDEARAGEAAKRLSSSQVRERALTALDRWLAGSNLRGTRRRVPASDADIAAARPVDPHVAAALQTVLRAADPDPYRDAVRAALVARDVKALKALAEKPEALAQPPRFAAVLGMLHAASGDRRRTVLESALSARPNDLELLIGLGNAAIDRPGGGAEGLRWLQAALAVQPRNPAVLVNLAVVHGDQNDFDKALELLHQAIAIDRTSANAHCNLGFVYFKLGKQEKAIAHCDEAIKLIPTSAVAHLNKGAALQELGHRKDAIAFYERAVGFDSEDPDIRGALGSALLAESDYAGAMVQLRKALELGSQRAILRTTLATALIKTGNLPAARTEIEAALSIDPKFHQAAGNYVQLATALREKGDKAAAIECLEKALQIDPDLLAAYLDVGAELQALKERDRAIACYRKALRLNANSAAVHYGMATTLHGSPEAILWWKRLIELDPKDARAFVDLTTLMRRMGRPVEAVCYGMQAVALNPKSAVAHNNLGTAFSSSGHPVEAIHCLTKSLQLDPTYAPGYVNLGNAYLANGERDKAISQYEASIARDKNFWGGHYQLGTALMSTDGPRALKHLKEAVRLSPNDAVARTDLGTVYFDLREFEEARVEFQSAIKLDPQLVKAHFNLGNALGALNRRDEAIAAYRQAIEVDRTFAPAHFNLGHTLLGQGAVEQGIASLREACRLQPSAVFLHDLAVVLAQTGDLEGAVAECRKEIEANRDRAEGHWNLGFFLMELGRYEAALPPLRKAQELGRGRPDWNKSDNVVRAVERMLALEQRLPDILAGVASTPQDRVDLAEVCLRYKKRYADAVLLFSKAFADAPSLAETQLGHRYNAACAAVLLASGPTDEAQAPSASDRARARQLALGWLQADLASYRDQANQPAAFDFVQKGLERWLKDPDLGGVRDPERMAGLPDAEREPWTKLWSDVRTVTDLAAKK